MPLQNHILKTKLLHVNSAEVQKTLAQLRESPQKSELKGRSLYFKGTKLGEIKPAYDDFLFSLHNPTFKTTITGGYLKLLDENGKYVKTFGNSNELSSYEREMLTMNQYRVIQTRLGCNVEIIDHYVKEEDIIPF